MIYAFDTETVNGEPFTIQFAGSEGAWLQRVTQDTILPVFLRFLYVHGEETKQNLLFAHHLEFDAGVTFIRHLATMWRRKRFTVSYDLTDGLRCDLEFQHAGSPHHRITLGSRRWLLIDTMSFFKLSLEQVCEDLQLPVKKLPRPHYLGTRPPDEQEWPAFEAYAVNDARATYELARFIVARHDDFGIPMTVSVAAMAGTIFRRLFLPGDQRVPFCEIEPGSTGLLEASLQSYHGGKNGLYVPPGVYDDVAEADIVSAYPHAMTALPPLTKGRWERVREYIPDAAGIYHVRGSIVRPCPYGVFMKVGCTDKIHEGRFDTWVTGWELASALDEIRFEVSDGYVWQPAAGAINPFGEYAEHFFAAKRDARKGDPRREMAKRLLNSLYGKTIQRTRSDRAEPFVAGPLFNPFLASQFTGHCRARLHTMEHQHHALHTSTDSILTRARDIPTGSALGALEIQARGRLLVLRPKLYVIQDEQGRVLKKALAGFHGRMSDLFDLLERGGGSYSYQHMVRPREALKTGEKPFRMISKKAHLHLPPEVFRMAAAAVAARPLA